jgi:hypothetical protein
MQSQSPHPNLRSRIISTVCKALLLFGAAANVLVLLPAVAASAWTGDWAASVVLVILSALVQGPEVR